MSIVVLFLTIYRDEKFAHTHVCAGRYSDKVIVQKKRKVVGPPSLRNPSRLLFLKKNYNLFTDKCYCVKLYGFRKHDTCPSY